MKSKSHKTGAVLLAVLLLFSTLSFTLDMHFCGHSLVDFKVFQQADDCGMAMDNPALPGMDCCSDVELAVSGQEDLSTPQWDVLNGPIAVYVTAVFEAFPMLLPVDNRPEFIHFPEYSPPKLVADLPVRNQVFLI